MTWVNFLPWRQRAIRRTAKRSGYFLLLSFLFVLSLFLIFSKSLSGKNEQLIQQISEWKEATQRAIRYVDRLKHTQRAVEHLVYQGDKLKQRNEQAVHWQNFILDMGKIIPDTVSLTALEKTENGLLIVGKSLDIKALALFLRKLEQQPLFSKVLIKNIENTDDLTFHFSFDVVLAPEETK